MTNKCTPDNVVGYLLGGRELNGLGVDNIDLFDDSPDMVSGWRKAKQNLASSSLSEFAPKAVSMIEAAKGSTSVFKEALDSLTLPSRALGEDIVKAVESFSEAHFKAYGNDLSAGRREFVEGITDLLDSVDTSKFTPNQEAYFKKYYNFYADGGELYRFNERHGLVRATGNAVTNTIKSSTNVTLGNVLEGVIKLPTFLPKTTFSGIVDALERTGGNLFKELPERANQGVYGHNYAGEQKDLWQGLMGLTDTPFKNIVYSAGELAQKGGGSKAVEEIAFKPRFGNLPPVHYTSVGSESVKLLNYRISHYRMLSDMIKDSVGVNGLDRVPVGLQRIATHTAMTSLVGGFGASAIGQLLGLIDPDWGDKIAETRNDYAKLVDTGGITQLGIGFNITKRVTDDAFKAALNTLEGSGIKGGEPDVNQLAMGVTDLMMDYVFLGSSNTIWSDSFIQKHIKLARDTFLGEVEAEEFADEYQERMKIPNPLEVLDQSKNLELLRGGGGDEDVSFDEEFNQPLDEAS